MNDDFKRLAEIRQRLYLMQEPADDANPDDARFLLDLVDEYSAVLRKILREYDSQLNSEFTLEDFLLSHARWLAGPNGHPHAPASQVKIPGLARADERGRTPHH